MFRCPFSIVSEKILSIETILTNFRLKLYSTQIDKSVVSLDLVGVSCGLKISSVQVTLWKSPINWNRLQTPIIGNDWTDRRIYGCRLYADDKRGLSRWEKGPWLGWCWLVPWWRCRGRFMWISAIVPQLINELHRNRSLHPGENLGDRAFICLLFDFFI